MYCNKCHTIIPNDEKKCPKCGYVNETEELEETKEIDLNEVYYKHKKQKKKIIHLLGIITLISLILITSIYILYDSNTLNTHNKTTSKVEYELKLNATFTFNNISINYNQEEYGTSKNTIFNKKDNNYNIELNLIKQNEYNKYIDKYKVSDTILGDIKTKSFILNSSTAHIFIIKEEYYLLKINSNNLSSTLNHLKRINDLDKISNTIKENHKV